MVHFVIFETRTSNYEISIKEYYVYTRCCDISNYFVKNASILSFSERPVYFFASSILSKMLNFVIFWEVFHHWILSLFFQFCQNAEFCQEMVFYNHLSKMVIFWNVDFKLWDKYKYTMLQYVLWYIKLFCQKCSILSFSERPVYFFASSDYFVKNA